MKIKNILAVSVAALVLSACSSSPFYHQTKTAPAKKASKTTTATNTSSSSKNKTPTLSAVTEKKEVPMAEIVKALPPEPPVTSRLDISKSMVEKSITSPTNEQEGYRKRALESLENLDTKELQTLAGDSSYGYLRPHAYMKLGEIFQRERDFSMSRKSYASVVDLAPGSELASRAEALIANIENASRVNSKSIGAILPLSGKNKVM